MCGGRVAVSDAVASECALRAGLAEAKDCGSRSRESLLAFRRRALSSSLFHWGLASLPHSPRLPPPTHHAGPRARVDDDRQAGDGQEGPVWQHRGGQGAGGEERSNSGEREKPARLHRSQGHQSLSVRPRVVAWASLASPPPPPPPPPTTLLASPTDRLPFPSLSHRRPSPTSCAPRWARAPCSRCCWTRAAVSVV